MMSPGFMNGMNPSTRCRSEPQMQVDVIRAIASRRFKIFGSGTRSTATLYGAHQINAFIFEFLFDYTAWSLASRVLREQRLPLGFGVLRASPRTRPVGLPDDRGDLP